MKTQTVGQSALMKLIEAKKAAAIASSGAVVAVTPVPSIAQPVKVIDSSLIPHVNKPAIKYNDLQLAGIKAIVAGESIAITGAAGCGKTTLIKGAIQALIDSGRILPFSNSAHKHLVDGTPGISLVSFTNKAVTNIKKVLPADLRSGTMTIHKLLEFEPEYEQVIDSTTGLTKTKMEFKPARNFMKPLPETLQVLVIDEAPMCPVSLWNLIADAIAHGIQVILIGDLQQLPPVFGKSIFIHAVQAGIKVIELTEVYRQALGSPIIALATEITLGKQIPNSRFNEFSKETEQGKVTIQPWKRKLSDVQAIKLIGMWLPEQIDKGSYDPQSDIILTPYNESFGTKIMNSAIASHLSKKLQLKVYEIYAGAQKKYFRVGERCLYQKSEARILSIEPNRKYVGKMPRIPSLTMDYAGVESNRVQDSSELSASSIDDVDFMLEAMGSHLEDGEKATRESSHTIRLEIPDLGTETTVSSVGEISSLDLGYAITVHKSQGSEYEKVFFITHACQATMIYRELIYTAITRAKKELVIVCEPNMFVKGINSQRLPGNNVKEKLEAFDRLMKVQKISDNEKPKKIELFLNRVANNGVN